MTVSKWFGKPCLKRQGRVFVALWQGNLAFKLSGAAHANALALPGARLFDPRGQGHAMKEWVQVDTADATILHELAQQALDYAGQQVQ